MTGQRLFCGTRSALPLLLLGLCAAPVAGEEEFVPQWAKCVVWYQVFPERFRDGDPSNNPTVEDILGADPQDPPREWRVHPWGSDWYERQDYELANGEPELWKHLLRRRYGGDLQGLIDKLDYLQDLGITGIYLNPVFQSPSLHKYDGISYHHIDPNFGPDPAGDRALIASEDPADPATWVWTSADELALVLIRQAYARNMRIIFDGVFNHLGAGSVFFRDVVQKQQASPFADWFIVRSWRDEERGQAFDYQGWFGVQSLPELREDEGGIVDGPRQYIFEAVRRWMNPKGLGCEDGIDGWRLDVAFCVAHAFWKDFRSHVRSINPEAYLTAELVLPPEQVLPYLSGDEFDGEMNYNFAFACAEFLFQPEGTRITASDFDRKLAQLRDSLPAGVAHVSQNLFGSHDANRIGSHIVNRERGIGEFRDWGNYFGASKAADNPRYSTRKPRPEDIELQKLFVILQMTSVGAPMIYYGDEVGLWGANDPDCRKPMLWEDIVYEDEAHAADGSRHAPDRVAVNRELREHYRRLIEIRKQSPALRLGSWHTLFCDDERGLLAFERRHGEDRRIVVLNNSPQEQRIAPGLLPEACYKDLLGGETRDSPEPLRVPPRWALLLAPCTGEEPEGNGTR